MNRGLAPTLFVLLVSMTAVKSQIRGPKNAVKKVGDSVTLECVTVNNNCHQVDWQKVEGLQSPKLVYRNSQGMLNTDSYPTRRYSVNSTGGCNLTITQLEINDSGRFICMQAVDSGEETRTSILVVIGVTESCLSNVTNNTLDKGDGYSFWCTINTPAKSVEPSNVTLSFHNKIVGETETTDEKQPLTVNTTLTGIAKKENITERVCRASFPSNTEANYDNTVAFLDICATQPLIVSSPVENPSVSLVPGKDDTLRCTADGLPPPTFKWIHWKSEADGDTLMIKGDVGDKYNCTATNMVKGRAVSKSVLYEVSSPPPPPPPLPSPGCGSGCVVRSVIGTTIVWVIISVASVLFVSWKNEWSPLYGFLHSRKNKKNADYPVVNIFISVSPPGPDKGITVRCTANGHPPPTFKWTNSKGEVVVDGDTLVIKCDAGDKYTCTATNTVNGKETSQNITIEFTSPPPEDKNGERANDPSTDDTAASRTCEASEKE